MKIAYECVSNKYVRFCDYFCQYVRIYRAVILPFCQDDYPDDFRISQLRFAKRRLRFALVSPGVVCGADPGSGLC